MIECKCPDCGKKFKISSSNAGYHPKRTMDINVNDYLCYDCVNISSARYQDANKNMGNYVEIDDGIPSFVMRNEK